MNYKLIILDLGNVLINFNHWIAANKLLNYSLKNLIDIYNLLFDSELTCAFEQGKINVEVFFSKVKEELGLSLDFNRFCPIWNEIFYLNSDNLGVYKLIHTLKKRYKIILLSNINKLHFEYLKENFRVFDPFDRIVLSYEVGFRKPDPNIYKYALDIFSIKPDEAFYIDDREDLVQASRQLSINAIQFKSFNSLKSALEKTGILGQEKRTLAPSG